MQGVCDRSLPAASTLSGTALAMYFESGDYIGLHRCAGLEMRTAMCSFLGKEVVVAIAVDRRVS